MKSVQEFENARASKIAKNSNLNCTMMRSSFIENNTDDGSDDDYDDGDDDQQY